MTRDDRCETCRFRAADATCRRGPPAANLVFREDGAFPVASFPTVKPEDWCGEWRPHAETWLATPSSTAGPVGDRP